MNRRDAIKRTTLLLGGTLSASAILGVMSGCQPEPVLNWTPTFFTTEEGNIVEQMAERILPRTDTPGATDAGVHTFIDAMMSGYYEEKDKLAFREALAKVDADAKAEHGKAFTKLTAAQQDGLLKKYDTEAYGATAGDDHFFKTMKELTILGFCTSEVGATEFLKYDPVPGDYKGCIPYSEVGSAWAT
ncbi:MAG TPA: gluconate 2-dehydrogenase subunit 3 family protein [Bacteroidetes bacterium]|nr:gluconate 2-dehydrogenase subunit 3 family protein [Bacteroidota bacterium]